MEKMKTHPIRPRVRLSDIKESLILTRGDPQELMAMYFACESLARRAINCCYEEAKAFETLRYQKLKSSLARLRIDVDDSSLRLLFVRDHKEGEMRSFRCLRNAVAHGFNKNAILMMNQFATRYKEAMNVFLEAMAKTH